MSQRVSPLVYPVWDSLRFLDLIDYFLSHVREVFDYNLFKYFLRPSLFLFFSWDPYNSNVGAFNLSQRSLKLSSILFILFSLFCSSAVISTILTSSSLIHSSASVIVLLIPLNLWGSLPVPVDPLMVSGPLQVWEPLPSPSFPSGAQVPFCLHFSSPHSPHVLPRRSGVSPVPLGVKVPHQSVRCPSCEEMQTLCPPTLPSWLSFYTLFLREKKSTSLHEK